MHWQAVVVPFPFGAQYSDQPSFLSLIRFTVTVQDSSLNTIFVTTSCPGTPQLPYSSRRCVRSLRSPRTFPLYSIICPTLLSHLNLDSLYCTVGHDGPRLVSFSILAFPIHVVCFLRLSVLQNFCHLQVTCLPERPRARKVTAPSTFAFT